MKKAKLICIICNVSPDEGIHVSGIKFIKGTKEPYNICKSCCLGERNMSFEAQSEYRKQVIEKIEKKILSRRSKL